MRWPWQHSKREVDPRRFPSRRTSADFDADFRLELEEFAAGLCPRRSGEHARDER